jgi:hypothetical protein
VSHLEEDKEQKYLPISLYSLDCTLQLLSSNMHSYLQACQSCGNVLYSANESVEKPMLKDIPDNPGI